MKNKIYCFHTEPVITPLTNSPASNFIPYWYERERDKKLSPDYIMLLFQMKVEDYRL